MSSLFRTKEEYSRKAVVYKYLELLVKKQLTKSGSKKKKTTGLSIRYIMYYIYICTGDNPLNIMLFTLASLPPKYSNVTIKKKENIMGGYPDNGKEVDMHYASISPRKKKFISVRLLSEGALSKSKKKYSSFNTCMCKEIINVYRALRSSKAIPQKTI